MASRRLIPRVVMGVSYTTSGRLRGVGLDLGRGLLEALELLAGGLDAEERRHRLEVDLVAPAAGELRHEVDVGDARLVADAEAAGGLLHRLLERGEAAADPVARPVAGVLLQDLLHVPSGL